MKKDEIIELLKEQIKGLRDDNSRLLDQIDALIKEVSSLKEALLQKGDRKSTRLNSSHPTTSRMPSSA